MMLSRLEREGPLSTSFTSVFRVLDGSNRSKRPSDLPADRENMIDHSKHVSIGRSQHN